MKKGVIFFAAFVLLVFCLNAQAGDMQSKPEDKNSPFGVLEFLHWNHPWNSYKYPGRSALNQAVGLMKEAGVSFVRLDFLWEDIEPEKGKFQFEKYDYIVDLLYKNNIGILGLLDYSAPWASPSQKWNNPSDNNRMFLEYARRVINRYKDKVKYWEVWNEPDSSIYWVKQDGLKSYCRLLKEAYLLAKNEDPECKILNGGFANGILSVNRLYDNGAKDYFDILNIHIFESPLNPQAIKRVLSYARLSYKVMQRNGDLDKKIWVTEIGSPGVKRGLKVKDWWLGRNPNERQQADWLRQVFTQLIREKNVERVFWAFFRDCNAHWKNGIDYFGLLRWDYSKKPAFFAYQGCVNKWKQARE